jgi:hypothetical protein
MSREHSCVPGMPATGMCSEEEGLPIIQGSGSHRERERSNSLCRPSSPEGNHESDTADTLLLSEHHQSSSHGQTDDNLHIDDLRDFEWLPTTLRPYFLAFFVVVALCLAIVVGSLTYRSSTSNGVASDDGSPGLFFLWRFAPTLLATIYTLIAGSILNDVRRTEIFARLSKPGGASAAATICISSRAWWYDPVDALSTAKNGQQRSWALFFASVIFITSLSISSISAGFLTSYDVWIERSIDFSTVVLPDKLDWQLDTQDSIMFRTISGAILGQEASTWIGADVAFLPFWPSDNAIPSFALNVSNNSVSREWRTKSPVFDLEFFCKPMKVARVHDVVIEANYTDEWNTTGLLNKTYAILILESDDGCVITFGDSNSASPPGETWFTLGGGWWAEPPDYKSPLLSGFSNSTSDCGDRTMFFSTTPIVHKGWWGLEAQLCSDQIFSANVGTTAVVNQTGDILSYDRRDYLQKRQLLDQGRYNTTQLRSSFINSDWSTHFLRYSKNSSMFDGPLMAIAASYGNNVSSMLANDIVSHASAMYQYYLGEMLLSAVESGWDGKQEGGLGNVSSVEKRIVASESVGITLATLLLLSCCCTVFVAWSTRTTRRPLSLSHDPGTIAAVATLIATQKHRHQAVFEGTDRSTQKALESRLDQRIFCVSEGVLRLLGGEHGESCDDSITHHDSSSDTVERSPIVSDNRPALLRLWMGGLLLVVLLIILASLIALYTISRTIGIHQSAFVYEKSFSLFEHARKFAPFSILPTFIAVGVKLWIAAIGDTLKRFQPFISMVDAPSTVERSLLAEYANTPLVLIPLKAAKHNHRVLVLIGLGALATEIRQYAPSS